MVKKKHHSQAISSDNRNYGQRDIKDNVNQRDAVFFGLIMIWVHFSLLIIKRFGNRYDFYNFMLPFGPTLAAMFQRFFGM